MPDADPKGPGQTQRMRIDFSSSANLKPEETRVLAFLCAPSPDAYEREGNCETTRFEAQKVQRCSASFRFLNTELASRGTVNFLALKNGDITNKEEEIQ